MNTVLIDSQGAVTRVVLNRPEVRNAFDERLIDELTQAFQSLPKATRVVVLAGEGPTFCAGADVQWMRRSKAFSQEENARDAAAMAKMLATIDECPLPVIVRIHGAALGGGSGLVAVCDAAVASDSAQFGFTEVRLGLIPAVISSFVVPRIGMGSARRYFLSGERFAAAEARSIGLVHEVVAIDALDDRIEALVREFLLCGPAAIAAAKKLLRETAGLPRDRAIEHTVRAIAALRVSPEAQEGLGAFLEKRKPDWS